MLGFPIEDHAILPQRNVFFNCRAILVHLRARKLMKRQKVKFLENPRGRICENKTYKLSSLFWPYRQTQNVRTTSGLNTILLKLTRVYHNTAIAFF